MVEMLDQFFGSPGGVLLHQLQLNRRGVQPLCQCVMNFPCEAISLGKNRSKFLFGHVATAGLLENAVASEQNDHAGDGQGGRRHKTEQKNDMFSGPPRWWFNDANISRRA